MDKIWLNLQLCLVFFGIILLIKVWIMTNDIKELKELVSDNNKLMKDIKELKDFIIKNNSTIANEVKILKNYIIDYIIHNTDDTKINNEERSVVYSRIGHKKYTVVKALPKGMMLCSYDDSFEPEYVELSIDDVIREGSVVYGRNDNKTYTVVKILSNRMLRLKEHGSMTYDSYTSQDVELSIDKIL